MTLEEQLAELKAENEQLNSENADLRVKLAAATCDALQQALAKIDELQHKLDEYEPDQADWDIENSGYHVTWMEGWGSDAIYCGDDFEKAKKIYLGKEAEGKDCVQIEHEVTKYLSLEDENEDT
jgi:regulator of replication initiation timing